MALTHKSKSEKQQRQKRETVFKRESPSRLFMSKAQVLRENAINKAKEKKFAEVKSSLEAEVEVEAIENEISVLRKRAAASKDEVVKKDMANQIKGLEAELEIAKSKGINTQEPVGVEPEVANEPISPENEVITDEIKKLSEKYNNLKGPGSKIKKEEIGEKIRVLESKLT